MSADVLRRAAALMRERAEDATPGPWEAGERIVWSNADTRDPYVITDGDGGDGGSFSVANAHHIASWHPAVALAVADWLEWMSKAHEDAYLAGSHALVVARAYLGESS